MDVLPPDLTGPNEGINRDSTTYFPISTLPRRQPPAHEAFGAARYEDVENQHPSRRHFNLQRPAPFAVTSDLPAHTAFYRRHERGAEFVEAIAANAAYTKELYASQKAKPHQPSEVGTEALQWATLPAAKSGAEALSALRGALSAQGDGARRAVALKRRLIAEGDANGGLDLAGFQRALGGLLSSAAEVKACFLRLGGGAGCGADSVAGTGRAGLRVAASHIAAGVLPSLDDRCARLSFPTTGAWVRGAPLRRLLVVGAPLRPLVAANLTTSVGRTTLRAMQG